MAQPDLVDFTERERFIVTYYRSAELSATWRSVLHDAAIVSFSAICIGLFLIRGEMGYGLAGWAIAVGRLLFLVIEGARWNRDFHSIFAKYDAKLHALADPANLRQTADPLSSTPPTSSHETRKGTDE